MEIHYSLTPQDMVAFNHYYLTHTVEGKRSHALMRFLPVILLTGIAFATLMAKTPDAGIRALCYILGGSAYAFFYPKLNHHILLNAFRKQLNGRETDGHIFRIDDQGISITSQQGKTAFYWNAIKEIASTNTHVFFFYNARCAAILTRRAFADAEQYTHFLQLVHTYHKTHQITL